MRTAIQLPWLAVLVAVALDPGAAGACSTFCMRDGEHIVFGKNYDWNVGDGMLVVNPRNVFRVADAAPMALPTRWTATYGSVSFNQYGREFPSGGINEAGLVVELMWLDHTRYPRPDGRPSLGGLQWIQYQLDTAASVADVVASDAKVRIGRAAPLHFLVADRHGEVATIEFLDGRMAAHTGDDLPVAALTNDTYASSLRHLRRLDEARRLTPRGNHSLDRFARAARRLRAGPRDGAAEHLVKYAFATLEDVAQGASTQWSIVYELDARRLHFRTYHHPAIKTLDLASVDFSCRAPALVLDLQTPAGGDVGPMLTAYTRERNRELIDASYRQTEFLASVPALELDRIARLPEAISCRD